MNARPTMSERCADDVGRLILNYPETARDSEMTRLLLTLAWLYGHSAGFEDYRHGVRGVLLGSDGEGA